MLGGWPDAEPARTGFAAQRGRSVQRPPEGQDVVIRVAKIGDEVAGDQGSQPAGELVLSFLPLFGGDGVAEVIFPVAVDLQVLFGHTFESNAELLDDPS